MNLTWEGEALSEPAIATAAQQELRPPKRHRGSAGASPSQTPPRLSRSFALPKPGPTNLTWEGEALSEPAKPPRLSRSFALPNETAAQQELRPPKTWADESGRAGRRPSRQRPPRLSRSFALPEPGPTNLGGRGSVRAGKDDRGSAGASPSQNLQPTNLTWEGEAPSEPDKAVARREASPSQIRAKAFTQTAVCARRPGSGSLELHEPKRQWQCLEERGIEPGGFEARQQRGGRDRAPGLRSRAAISTSRELRPRRGSLPTPGQGASAETSRSPLACGS